MDISPFENRYFHSLPSCLQQFTNACTETHHCTMVMSKLHHCEWWWRNRLLILYIASKQKLINIFPYLVIKARLVYIIDAHKTYSYRWNMSQVEDIIVPNLDFYTVAPTVHICRISWYLILRQLNYFSSNQIKLTWVIRIRNKLSWLKTACAKSLRIYCV